MTSYENPFFPDQPAEALVYDEHSMPPIPLEEREAYLQSRLRRQNVDAARMLLPESLPQIGKMGCDAACISYVDRLVGKRQTTPADVDSVFNRAPDKPLNAVAANLWLLDRGIRVTNFTTDSPEENEMRAFLDGLTTLPDIIASAENYFGKALTGETRTMYEQYYSDLREAHLENKSRFDSHTEAGNLCERTDQPITFELAQSLVREGKTVRCLLNTATFAGSVHAVLLFKSPVDGEMLMYNPATNFVGYGRNMNIDIVPQNLENRLATETITAFY